MQSLFNASTYNETIDRIHNLSPDLPAQWGKMNVAQMCAHCKEAFKVPLSEKPYSRILMGLLLGWMIKSKLYNEEPWKKNLPTSFLIKGERDFKTERQNLMDLINKFYTAGPMGISQYPHPFFGKITPEQWGKAMYKHLDHHLQQFGV